MNVHFTIVNVFFLLASFKDPGYVHSNPNIKFEKLVEEFDANSLCPTCETMYTFDRRHCYICDRCINKFDHHCQWINNCVGKDNHYVFYIYITSLLGYFIQLFVVCFTNQGYTVEGKDLKTEYSASGITNQTIVNPWLYTTDPLQTDLDYAQSWLNLILLQVLAVTTLFMLPLSYLVIIQTQNVF